jgi:acyl carrier protein
MGKDQILETLTIIFRDVLDNETIQVRSETTATDIEEWDSLTHIQLVVAIEKHFKLRFTSAEIREWKNIGEMCVTILKRLEK